MADTRSGELERSISRDQLAQFLDEDFALEYQAILSDAIYSQVLEGTEYMNIANQLELHAKEELDRALIVSRQIDYLGAMPMATPKPLETLEECPPHISLLSLAWETARA